MAEIMVCCNGKEIPFKEFAEGLAAAMTPGKNEPAGKRYILFVSTNGEARFDWGVPFATSNSIDKLKSLMRGPNHNKSVYCHARNSECTVAQASILDTTSGLVVRRWEHSWSPSDGRDWETVEQHRWVQSI